MPYLMWPGWPPSVHFGRWWTFWAYVSQNSMSDWLSVRVTQVEVCVLLQPSCCFTPRECLGTSTAWNRRFQNSTKVWKFLLTTRTSVLTGLLMTSRGSTDSTLLLLRPQGGFHAFLPAIVSVCFVIYATADEAVAYMFYSCFFLFFVFCLFFSVRKKYETTVLGNGWTDFHETFTKR